MKKAQILILAAAVAVGLLFTTAPAAADPEQTGYPSSMASTGDSITRATNTVVFGDSPQNSWSTGSNSTVQSHYLRILQQNSAINGLNFNDAVSGARMTNLDGQVQNAVIQGVEYVTILMGANDVCTSSEGTMTPVTTYRSQFEQAMNTLTLGLPDARIYVSSIPDIFNLWFILKDNPTARFIWSLASICQSLLANPLSTDQADVDRRDSVRQRNIDFNTQLAEVCAQYVHCRFDNNVAFNTPFQVSDVSALDFFHPSLAGQTNAASVTWGETFDFTDGAAPVSTATLTPLPGGVSVSIAATDDAGVSGVEYRIDGGAFQRYGGPVTAPNGSLFTYRAVDVNGNIEATHSCVVGSASTPLPGEDCDGDSLGLGSPLWFRGDIELFVGTDPQDPCADTATADDEADDKLAVDLNDDQAVNVLDRARIVLNLLGQGVDDDGDGLIDEDPLTGDGIDDDGDGFIDEDPGYDARLDLNADGFINVLDRAIEVLYLLEFKTLGGVCTSL